MDNIYLSDYHILSSQGDLPQTINAIKSGDIRVSSKVITTNMEVVEAPYFLFEDEIAEEQSAVYKALREIALKVVNSLDNERRKSTALIIGTAIVDLNIADSIEASVYEDERKEYSSKKYSVDSYAKEISREFGLNDFTMTINTACTSSANALLEGANLIESGIFESVVVIGAEIFSTMMSSGFSGMKLLSLTNQKPFDKNRDGLILGEGLAGILLSREKSPWVLKGGFSNCNSVNITAVSEDGREFVEVMKNALVDSMVCAKNIRALKTHATSTPASDLSEINAIGEVFDKGIVFSALKPYIGHTIGACGVLELSIFISCIDNGFIPKTISCDEPMDKKYVPLKNHKECSEGIFMLNYFGFGGNNTSIIIEKEQI